MSTLRGMKPYLNTPAARLFFALALILMTRSAGNPVVVGFSVVVVLYGVRGVFSDLLALLVSLYALVTQHNSAPVRGFFVEQD